MKSKKSRQIYLIMLIISSLLFIFFRLPYRNYIYENKIFDFHIADSSPNFFAVFMFVFYKKLSPRKLRNTTICSASFLGLSVYEIFIQQHIYKATFDINDIIASAIASLIAYLICMQLDKQEEKLNKAISTTHTPRCF